jgi:hypothetical protein
MKPIHRKLEHTSPLGLRLTLSTDYQNCLVGLDVVKECRWFTLKRVSALTALTPSKIFADSAKMHDASFGNDALHLALAFVDSAQSQYIALFESSVMAVF